MKKNLQNAMAQNFQKMVSVPTESAPSETKKKKTETTKVKAQAPVEENVAAKPVEVTQNVPVNNVQEVVNTPVNQVYQQPQPVVMPEPQPVPVQYTTPTPVSVPETQYVTNVNPTPVVQQQIPVVNAVPQEPVRETKKSIPLMPEEKSSGVLHIRLGELRSYVDFMTQSSKMSYQQYISNLIEQDYEKNKELYLKYKSFMDQLNL